MSVSVIIPVYNHAKYLRQRINSILDQSFKEYELIILDDGSTDDSQKIILEFKSKFPEAIINFNENNSGRPFHQWNKGVALSTGEFIWIAESDDFADSHFLERTVSEISRSEEIGLVYTDSWVLDEEKGIKYRFSTRDKKRKVNIEFTAKSFLENPIPNVSSVLFRKAAFLKAWQADPSQKFCGDWMLYYFIHRNWKISYLPEPLNTFRLHAGSQYHKYYNNNLFIMEVADVYKNIIRSNKFSITILAIMLVKFSKRLLLRLLFLIKVPSVFLPEIPRRPGQVEYI